VELIMELEEETGTTIPDEVAARFKSVRDVIEYLRRRQ
jgi:acyl carrier protein